MRMFVASSGSPSSKSRRTDRSTVPRSLRAPGAGCPLPRVRGDPRGGRPPRDRRGEDVIAALDEGHLRAEARVELSQLAADRAGADDDEALGDAACARCLTARPRADLGETLDRRHRRQGSSGDHELVVFERLAVHIDAAGLVDPSRALDQLGVLSADPLHLAGVVLPGTSSRHLKTCTGSISAETPGVPRLRKRPRAAAGASSTGCRPSRSTHRRRARARRGSCARPCRAVGVRRRTLPRRLPRPAPPRGAFISGGSRGTRPSRGRCRAAGRPRRRSRW